MTADATPLLEIDNLRIEFRSRTGWTPVVEDFGLQVRRGETVGLVGESGSGKTVASLATLGLVEQRGGRVAAGSIRFDGHELVGADEAVLRTLRGARIAMIFQQASRSLNPAFTVGDQIGETLRRHLGLGRRAARARACELLDRVRVPNAQRRVDDYPHMFSGGMLQRVMIAMAVSCEPDLLLADEPTTALDVSVQASVLELLGELQVETGMSIVFISHDLAVIAEIADRVAVMYAGQLVEAGPAEEVFVNPQHPYTEGLLGSIPALGGGGELVAIRGSIPSPHDLPRGCRFHPRCAYAVPGRCDVAPPPLLSADSPSIARCVRVAELELAGVAVP